MCIDTETHEHKSSASLKNWALTAAFVTAVDMQLSFPGALPRFWRG